MAKKNLRALLGLVCEVCNKQNYVISKSKLNTASLKQSKYCNKCQKHISHKERKKLD